MIAHDYPKMLYRTADDYLIVDGLDAETLARKDGFMDYADLFAKKPKPTKSAKSNTQEAVDQYGDSNV